MAHRVHLCGNGDIDPTLPSCVARTLRRHDKEKGDIVLTGHPAGKRARDLYRLLKKVPLHFNCVRAESGGLKSSLIATTKMRRAFSSFAGADESRHGRLP